MNTPHPYGPSEQAFRKVFRDKLKKSKCFTRSQKEIIGYLLNLWLNHRYGPKGYIHPGRPLIERRTKTSRRTINYTLKMLRDLKILIPIAFEEGVGHNATRYLFNLERFVAAIDGFDKSGIKAQDGVQNCTPLRKQGAKSPTKRGAEIAPCTNKETSDEGFPGARDNLIVLSEYNR